MLKRIVINQRMCPVPIPIQNMDEAIYWLETSMMPEGQTITSLSLDGKSLIDLLGREKEMRLMRLNPDSILEVRIEAATDLVLQSLETAHSLCRAVLSGIKVTAVNLWQSPLQEDHPDLVLLIEDLNLVCELVDHSVDLVASEAVDFGILQEIRISLSQLIGELKSAMSQRLWREAAKILLRDFGSKAAIETTLRMFQEEFESVHLRVLTNRKNLACSPARAK